MSKVWLVTGSASGLGRNIAGAVLACGDRLVATARDPRRLEDLVKTFGDLVRTAPLDVADEDAAKAPVQGAVGAFGRLDVVVNNAGYGDVAPFEQLSRAKMPRGSAATPLHPAPMAVVYVGPAMAIDAYHTVLGIVIIRATSV
jgi:NAD(P)-dependent dehydrogenase (short-subunit alcohol dehydrogenase family)